MSTQDSNVGIPGAGQSSAPVVAIKTVTVIDPSNPPATCQIQCMMLVDENGGEMTPLSEQTGRRIADGLDTIAQLLRDAIG